MKQPSDLGPHAPPADASSQGGRVVMRDGGSVDEEVDYLQIVRRLATGLRLLLELGLDISRLAWCAQAAQSGACKP